LQRRATILVKVRNAASEVVSLERDHLDDAINDLRAVLVRCAGDLVQAAPLRAEVQHAAPTPAMAPSTAGHIADPTAVRRASQRPSNRPAATSFEIPDCRAGALSP
jgi:hypothetical protein